MLIGSVTNIGLFDLQLYLPIVVMIGSGLLLLLIDLAFEEERSREALPYLAMGGAVLSTVLLFTLVGAQGTYIFNGLAMVDGFGLFTSFLIGACTIVLLLMTMGHATLIGVNSGEFYGLILMASGSMMAMAMSDHLVTLFLGFETFSIALYILAAVTRGRSASTEAALKYFIMGAFSSGVMVFGITLIYGATGSLSLPEIVQILNPNYHLMAAGMALTLIGLAFKVGAIPFHWWVPDVYQGAPTPITGYMASAVKVAGFAILARIAATAFELNLELWLPIVWGLAAATMVVGNVVALAQTDVKRLLAYSSIAHTGYALIAVVAAGAGGSAEAAGALPFYLLTYVPMNLGAFAVVAAVGQGRGTVTLEHLKGLARERPGMAVALTIFMVSLAGIPPTAGFVGKYYVFMAAVQEGFVWLAVIGVLTTLVSLYYYLRIVVVMYFHEPAADFIHPSRLWGLKATTGLMAAVVVLLGILPGWSLRLAQKAAAGLF